MISSHLSSVQLRILETHVVVNAEKGSCQLLDACGEL